MGFGGVEAVWVWEGCPLVQPDHLWVCVFKARIFTTTGNSPSLLSRQEKKGKNFTVVKRLPSNKYKEKQIEQI